MVSELPKRLAAIDLDGTLLDSSGSVSARTTAALDAWSEVGNGAVVVTARPHRSLARLRDALGRGVAFAICSNGASIYEFDSGEPSLRGFLSEDLVKSMVESARVLWPGVYFALEYGDHMARDKLFPADESPPDEVVVGRLLKSIPSPVIKLIIGNSALTAEAMEGECTLAFGQLASVTRSGSDYIEIGPLGVDKAGTLAEFCGSRGVDRANVIAFGDMPNDTSMLEFAGHSVAMANAHASIKKLADEVTTSNDHDGVAVVLERLLGCG